MWCDYSLCIVTVVWPVNILHFLWCVLKTLSELSDLIDHFLEAPSA